MDVTTFRKLTKVLGKEHNINILEEVNQRGWATASEIAKELKIHVATSMRKLSELEDAGFLKKRVRKGNNRETCEYALKKPKIDLSLDFAQVLKQKSLEAVKEAQRLFIKERSNDNVVYDMNESERRIIRINFMQKAFGGLRRKVGRSLDLTELEGRFLWNLPFQSDDPKSVFDICEEGGIKMPEEMKKVIEFVSRLNDLGVVEIMK